MKFSNEPTLWRPSVVAPSEKNCEDAVEWIKTFQAYGNACTVEALQVSLLTGFISVSLKVVRIYCCNVQSSGIGNESVISLHIKQIGSRLDLNLFEAVDRLPVASCIWFAHFLSLCKKAEGDRCMYQKVHEEYKKYLNFEIYVAIVQFFN